MEFKFKRKYTNFFIIAVLLHLLVLAFWFLAPTAPFGGANGKQTVTLLSLINCELIQIFYLGLFRKKYFAYYDKLVIKRSFFKTLTINYKDILNIKEKNNDTIFLTFGVRPSFKITYAKSNKAKKTQTIRSDNNQLLLKVIKNELDIAKKK